MVRNYVRKTDKASYSKETLREAVRAVQTGHLSGYNAAKVYKIPRMTIMDHVNKKRFKSKTLGRRTVFPVEEEIKLAKNLHLMEKNGFGISKKELLEMVRDYVQKNEISTPFKDDMPGEAWFYGFKNRHNLSVKKPQAVEYARKKAIDPFIVYPYFDLLEKTIDDLNLREKPSAIWNLDETSFCKDPSKTKVVGAKGYAATRVIASPGRDNTTVLLGASALGGKTPPLIVFKGKNVWDEWTSPEGYPGTTYAATTNGWMESDVFEIFFKKTFLPAVGDQRPILLIYDGHSTHVGLNIIEEARQENVTILKLPPHSSHVLQPLDVAVMKSFKDKWDPLLVQWQRLNVGIPLPKKEFARLIGQIWSNIDPQVLKNGFRKTGIFPPCREEVAEREFNASQLKRWKEFQITHETLRHGVETITTNEVVQAVEEANEKPVKHPLSLLTLSLRVLTQNTSPSPHTTFTDKPVLLSKTDCEEILAGPSKSSQSSAPAIKILENVKVNLNITFEDLLLEKVKAGSLIKLQRRKMAEGAEVITHDDVLHRKMEETVKRMKKEQSLKQKQNVLNKNQVKREKTKIKVVPTTTSERHESIPEINDENDCEEIQHWYEDKSPLVPLRSSSNSQKMEESIKKKKQTKEQKPRKQIQKFLKKNTKNCKRQVSPTRGKKRKVSTSSSDVTDESLPELDNESDYEDIKNFYESVLASESDNEIDVLEKENVSNNISTDHTDRTECKFPEVADWLLVKFATKKTLKFYVGVVTEINVDKNNAPICVVQYLRKANGRNRRTVFTYPHVEDISELRHLEDIVLFLPEPIKERRGLIRFEKDVFSNYNIK